MSIPYRLHETRQKNIILNLPLLLNFIEHNTAVDAGQQQQQLQILLKLSTKLWVNKWSKRDVTSIHSIKKI